MANDEPGEVLEVPPSFGKVSLDLFWLRDDSLEGADALPSPDVLAVSIVEDLQAALEQFSAITEDLGNGTITNGK